jgi:PAS domain S-box-containing protein
MLPTGPSLISLWEQYQWYVVAAAGVTLVQAALIAGLLRQRARRRRVELALRESEQHFHLMADTAPVLIWRSGADTGCDFFNKPWLDFRGRRLEQEQGSGWTEGVHPDDRAGCLATYVEAFEARKPFRMEYRLRRADDEYRWVLDIGVPRYADGGQFTGYIGSAVDITDRKQIEEQNHDLAGRLIAVQEQERTRIARDLHDDVSQQVASVAILLSALKRKLGKRDVEPEIDVTLTTLQQATSLLADAIRNLSHELHPSILKHVGLVEILRRHCGEIAARHHLDVNFSAEDGFGSLNPDVALCLFRVAQEALANAVRHARARTVRVELKPIPGAIQLQVEDDGIGFVVSERIGSGLGLRSIDERVRLNRGHVAVESRPGTGTRLVVSIPLSAAAVSVGRVS